jgi:hypothetical protein
MTTINVTENTVAIIKEAIQGPQGISGGTNVVTRGIVYVSADGDDVAGNGSFGLPFLTIEKANDHAIALVNPVVDWDECAIVKVRPGKYTEHLTNSHRRVFIVGEHGELEGWPKDVVIYNTGADAAHYPIDTEFGLNLIGITVKVDAGGVYGKIINKALFSMCTFEDGYFIENPDSDVNMYFNFCYLGGKSFNLTGVVNHSRFFAFRRCDMQSSEPMIFGSTGVGFSKTLKLESSKLDIDLQIKGDWSLLSQITEIYLGGKITFDTNGSIDIYNNIIVNGIHFISDTAGTKRIINCFFREITMAADIVADVVITAVEYAGNQQDKGLCSNFQLAGPNRAVGGFARNKYCSLQAAISSIPASDAGVIDLHESLSGLDKLVLNSESKIVIKGSKEYTLTFTGDIVEVGANQEVSFHELALLDGGEMKINGANAILAFEGCLTATGYITVASGVGSMFISYFSSLQSISGHPALTIDNIDTMCVVGYSRVKGFVDALTGEPAVNFNVEADSKFKAKFSTFLHGKGGSNSPIIRTGSFTVSVAIYNCAGNKDLTPTGISNTIGVPNITVDPQLDF